jgi:hypothetical protein
MLKINTLTTFLFCALFTGLSLNSVFAAGEPFLSEDLRPEESIFGALIPGKIVGRHIFGLARDFQGDPIQINNNPLIYKPGDNNDYLNHVRLEMEDKIFTVSIFDHLIAGVYLSEWHVDQQRYSDTTLLNLAAVKGITRPTSAFKSAWNSVVFSEYSLINAAQAEDFRQEFKPFFKNKADLVKPYHYGWVSEVILLDQSGQAKTIKNYALGRLSASHVVSMPDNKTYYIFDSQHSGNLYLFIAAEAKSMAKGTLYAVQNTIGKISYLSLGTTSALKMKFKLKKAKFSNFFKMTEPVNQQCESNFDLIKTVYGEECLSFQKKNKKYVGQFEPIRTAALLGGKVFFKPRTNMKQLTGMKLNESTQKLEFSLSEGVQHRFGFEKNKELGSDFIIHSN